MLRLINAELCITSASFSPVKMVGRQLIDLIKSAVDRFAANISVAEIPDDEVVSPRLAEARIFQVDTAHPKSLPFQ